MCFHLCTTHMYATHSPRRDLCFIEMYSLNFSFSSHGSVAGCGPEKGDSANQIIHQRWKITVNKYCSYMRLTGSSRISFIGHFNATISHGPFQNVHPIQAQFFSFIVCDHHIVVFKYFVYFIENCIPQNVDEKSYKNVKNCILSWDEREKMKKKQPLMWTKQTCVPIGTIHIRRFHHDRCCAQATKTKQIQFFFPLKITFCCVWALEIYSLFALWKRIYRSICLMWFCFIRLCIFSFDFGVFFRFDKSHFAYMILHTYDSWHSFKCIMLIYSNFPHGCGQNDLQRVRERMNES